MRNIKNSGCVIETTYTDDDGEISFAEYKHDHGILISSLF